MAAAAAVGARNGRLVGEQIARERRAKERAMVESYQAARRRMADKVMEIYDVNQSSHLSRDELGPVLQDFSKEVFGYEEQPSDEEIEFLFALCDKRRDPNGKIDKDEVGDVIDAWQEFLERKKEVAAIRKKFDTDKNFEIDMGEMQPLLDEVHGDAVPPEVTAWIFQQADLHTNGFLSDIELARALLALKVWERDRSVTSRSGFTTLDKYLRPPEDLPPPRSKSCCVL